MPRSDPNYRTNPARGVYLFGPFSDKLLPQWLTRIHDLRTKGNEPISVFINSPGGTIRTLEILHGALACPDADAQSCRIITAAVGDAGSAAATLLSLGDYAIAYPHSMIHFHGARLSEITATAEDATQYATYLSRLNRQAASDLAEVMINRLVHRYTILKTNFPAIKADPEKSNLSELGCFALSIRPKLSRVGKRLVDRSMEQVSRAIELTNRVMPKAKLKGDEKAAIQDARVLRAVVAFDLRKNKGDEWRLDEAGINSVVSDYHMLRDYVIGEHRSLMDNLVKLYGVEFLSPEELTEYHKLEKDKPADVPAYLNDKSYHQLMPFWYFTVCLCRQLQSGENRITPFDAYWLGAVDEVIGTELHGVRSVAEADVPPAPVT